MTRPADYTAALRAAIAAVPPGRWAVGVSGGADSVALLSLLRGRADILPHVVHLDHEARGPESAADARFVAALAADRQLPCTATTRSAIEAAHPRVPRARNVSARYRAARLALFGTVVREHALAGVILAHHADDQAETVLHRLLRAPTFAGLGGMRADVRVGGLRVLRPLLATPGAALRAHLRAAGLPWREDASNASPAYLRNRLRPLLRDAPDVAASMLALGDACAALNQWAARFAPALPEAFPGALLRDVPPLLADVAARRWLAARGVPAAALGPAVVARLLAMARDAASPARQDFPGNLRLGRRAGVIGRVPGRAP